MKDILLLSLLFILTLNISIQQLPEDSFNVATYNIHHGRGLNGQINIKNIAEVLNQTNADIIAIQEVDRLTQRSGNIDILNQLSQLTESEYVAFGKNLNFDGGEYGNAIISKFPIQSVKNFQFDDLSGEQRGVLAVEISIQNHSLLFLNTHLDHTPDREEERVLYAEKIIDEILPSYQSDAVILAGDLNDIPGSQTYQTIHSKFKDAWNEAGQGDGFTIPVKNPERRIDYIFYQGNIKATEANVPYTEASDHLPLFVRFRFVND